MKKINNAKPKRGNKRTPIKITYKGINFQSKLELTMYKALLTAGIKADYEKEIFTFNEAFVLPNNSYERFMNGKGVFRNRKDTTVNSMIYTPDFTSYDFIIEVKGHANERFPVAWKLFKLKLKETNDNRDIYKPQSLKDIMETVKLIKKKRNEHDKAQITKASK